MEQEKVIQFSFDDFKKEIKKYNTSDYHISLDGKNQIVTLKKKANNTMKQPPFTLNTYTTIIKQPLAMKMRTLSIKQ